MKKKLSLLNRNQMGFTLVEMLIAVVVAAIIGGGITGTVYQLVKVSNRNISHLTAAMDVAAADRC